MHKDLVVSLSLIPMKYLIDLFAPYSSYLKTNILLASMTSISNSFFFLS